MEGQTTQQTEKEGRVCLKGAAVFSRTLERRRDLVNSNINSMTQMRMIVNTVTDVLNTIYLYLV